MIPRYVHYSYWQLKSRLGHSVASRASEIPPSRLSQLSYIYTRVAVLQSARFLLRNLTHHLTLLSTPAYRPVETDQQSNHTVHTYNDPNKLLLITDHSMQKRTPRLDSPVSSLKSSLNSQRTLSLQSALMVRDVAAHACPCPHPRPLPAHSIRAAEPQPCLWQSQSQSPQEPTTQ